MLFLDSIKKMIRSILRYRLNTANRARLQNKDFTLFASNCVGGVLYSELKLLFRSPTINLWIPPADFIKFCTNPHAYMSIPFEAIASDKPYPVAHCGDITLHLVHYASVQEAQEAWQRRAKRINWDNIFIMMSERDGCTEQDLKNFDALPNPHKVVFVHQLMPQIGSYIYLPGTEIQERENSFHKVVGLTAYNSWKATRYIDLFDYVEFFNTGKLKQSNPNSTQRKIFNHQSF